MVSRLLARTEVIRAPEAACRAEVRLTHVVELSVDPVFRTLRRLGVPEADIDDCIQQVFSTLTKRIADIGIGAERAFALGTAVRVAADYRRTQRRRRDEATDPNELECSDRGELSPDALLEQKRGLELLDAIIDQLPADARAVFVLTELERLTMAEVAQLLEIPAGTVASRLRRARERFESICRGLEEKP
jgi:RNA polymerase sigma-70 factor, ECF subfamily